MKLNDLLGELPEDLHRQVFTHASWTERRSDSYTRLAFLGDSVLGLRRMGVVPHGRFSRRGFANAIRLAARGAEEDVVGRTHAALEAAGALRSAPSAGPATVPGT